MCHCTGIEMREQTQLEDSVISLYYGDLGNLTQVVRLGRKCLYSRRHLAVPIMENS